MDPNEKVGEARKELDEKNMLLSDEEVVKIVKEAREEWRRFSGKKSST